MPKKIKKKSKRLVPPKQKKGVYKVKFVFTMNEIGVPPPTAEELKMMESISPRAAKQFKNLKPLEHVKVVPVEIVRDPSLTFKEQWTRQRALVKTHLIEQRQKMEEQILQQQQDNSQIHYDPNAPTTLDLDNLTTGE